MTWIKYEKQNIIVVMSNICTKHKCILKESDNRHRRTKKKKRLIGQGQLRQNNVAFENKKCSI